MTLPEGTDLMATSNALGIHARCVSDAVHHDRQLTETTLDQSECVRIPPTAVPDQQQCKALVAVYAWATVGHHALHELLPISLLSISILATLCLLQPSQHQCSNAAGPGA